MDIILLTRIRIMWSPADTKLKPLQQVLPCPLSKSSFLQSDRINRKNSGKHTWTPPHTAECIKNKERQTLQQNKSSSAVFLFLCTDQSSRDSFIFSIKPFLFGFVPVFFWFREFPLSRSYSFNASFAAWLRFVGT